MMQDISTKFLVGLVLMAASACGSDKKGGGDATAGDKEIQDCQSYAAKNSTKYLCPEGYFCEYAAGVNMSDPTVLGKCKAMETYKPCMKTVPCDSGYAPKCETANETAYCDWVNQGQRCHCVKPGPFAEVDDPGPVKQPTTTK